MGKHAARDYSICMGSETGDHGPLIGNYDPELPDGYIGIFCVSCGITTGVPIATFVDDIDWG